MPTTVRAKRAESLPADERRAMIIEAMLPLLLEHGEMVTTRQIAEAAGIAEGTIFRVFADKDELIARRRRRMPPTRPSSSRRSARSTPTCRSEQAVTEAVRILQRRTLDMARLMACVGPRHHGAGRSRTGPGLVALFAGHRDEITAEPAAAARWLAALTMSTSHPMLGERAAGARAHRRAVPARCRQRGPAVLNRLLRSHLRPYRRDDPADRRPAVRAGRGEPDAARAQRRHHRQGRAAGGQRATSAASALLMLLVAFIQGAFQIAAVYFGGAGRDGLRPRRAGVAVPPA